MLKTKPYFKAIGKHFVIWFLAFSIYAIIRSYGQEIIRNNIGQIHYLSIWNRLLFQLMVAIIASLLFGTYSFLFNKLVVKRFSFGKTVLIGSFGYVIIILAFILFVFSAFGRFFDSNGNVGTFSDLLSSGHVTVIVFYCFLVGFLIEFISQVNINFGPGNLRKLILGQFYEPREEERIFMFLDMRSSTVIAEKLGHIKYSQLIQDCFKDIHCVAKFDAEVYQYVGDEVVLTWKKNNGLKNNNCVKAYFAYVEQLRNRKKYYEKKYGLVPEFKAGVNIGKVTVAEVGVIKREIAYHGDTLNTAARIQARCNEFKRDFLASETLIESLSTTEGFDIDKEGEVVLRGKAKKITIYSISNC